MSNRIAKMILLMLIAVTYFALLQIPVQPVQAQLAATQPVSGPLPAGVTPNVTITTQARISFRPNPIGLGQIFLVNVWTTPGLHSDRFHSDYTVTITKPDGTKDIIVMDSYCADATAWIEYLADQIGEWKLQFDFLGTYFPTGRYYDGYIVTNSSGTNLDSAYYKPSSTPVQTLVVQNEIIASWPPSSLPTDYWTRPVSIENREWWSIAGDYPWHGPNTNPLWDELYPNTNRYWSDRYRFTPWVEGPESAHIVWKQLGQTGAGIVGGDNTMDSYHPERSRPGAPNIVMSGRAFDTYTKPGSGKTGVTYWRCYDIRTGGIFWERPLETGESAPTVICYEIANPAVPGTNFKGSLTASLVYIGGGYLRKYDPWTGVMSGNYSISPLTTGTYYRNGYALSVQNIGTTANPAYRLINWTTLGTSNTFSQRIISNTTYARSSLPTLVDYNVGLGATVSGITQSGAYAGITVTGYDLLTGTQLWTETTDDPLFSGSSSVADHGKVAVVSMRGYWLAWDLRTGKLAWKTEELEYPWDASGWGVYGVQSAYGYIYWEGYMALYAIDWETGAIAWRYHEPSVPFETPYSGYVSLRSNALVADGKIYLCNDEHSPTSPLTRGWKLHCVNATTGEGIWKITGSMRPSVIADGYFAAANMYDGYLYWFGKGKSATTVEGPKTAIELGQSVVITGTVLDQSPGQPGTPCVSKDSMATQMEYLHMQKPIDGIWHNETITGVPVTLTAIDEDGAVFDLGSVTTNGYYGTFEKAWAPPAEGTYKIIASFAADDSYGSSAAATAVAVGPAPAEITIPEQITPPDYTMTIAIAAIAIIVTVIIAVAIAVMILRKRQ